jgi:hypothetical protein
MEKEMLVWVAKRIAQADGLCVEEGTKCMARFFELYKDVNTWAGYKYTLKHSPISGSWTQKYFVSIKYVRNFAQGGDHSIPLIYSLSLLKLHLLKFQMVSLKFSRSGYPGGWVRLIDQRCQSAINSRGGQRTDTNHAP